MCKYFGWTYNYLLWGIAWLNVQIMLADMPRSDVQDKPDDEQKDDSKVTYRELKTKDDIKNYIKGII